ncbi:hypothetical protein [Pseudofrankia sp. DC12]|uniref:hypothetical protein n=1 Tax=Pseudofrankia sp. DC12 TaxID=683315 RepID=UPI0012FA461B|nr:hypothetical protein [Pseudofrankia sp. DC12]
MAIRREIREFVEAGGLPSGEAGVDEIRIRQEMLSRIPGPVSNEEASLLVDAFGPDDCYGLAWSLLHLIETAPGDLKFDDLRESGNVWVRRLMDRAEIARHLEPGK